MDTKGLEYQIKALEKKQAAGGVKNPFALANMIKNLKKKLEEKKYEEFLGR